MLHTGQMRSVLALSLAVLLLSFGGLRAEPETVKWEPSRSSSPETVEELKALQDQVKKIVSKVSNSTVGVLVGAGAGSGVIVSEDGLVMTAAHVIGKPGQIARFVLPDGTVVRGKTLGSNPKIDSGLAQITDKPPKTASWPGAKDGKWPKAELGEGIQMKKGQWVVSLGHPGGPKRDRPPPVRVGRFDVFSKGDTSLRTDCTLVGGDSGGPLFDLNGKVVGIHSRIGIFLEMNIHVPAESFKNDWDRMLRGDLVGRATSVEMGITLDDDAERPTVSEVAEGGPADKAGIKPGDVILRLNDQKVLTTDDLTQMLSAYDPGQKVKIMVDRDGKPLTLDLTFDRRRRR